VGERRRQAGHGIPVHPDDERGILALGIELKRALVLVMLLERTPGLTQLLTDLRYQVEVAPNAELGGLPRRPGDQPGAVTGRVGR
jgi:hypothetical protein